MLKWNYSCNISKFRPISSRSAASRKLLHSVNSAKYREKNAQRKIKCKTSVTSNSLKLGVLLAKTYTCYDVSYVLYTVCTVLMEYMYTVQVLLLCLLIKVSEIKIIVWLFFYNKPLVQRVFNLQ